MVVHGLNECWSAVLLDRTHGLTRPLGMLEGAAWATVVMHGQEDLFIGHLAVSDHREITLQVTQTDQKQWTLEVHNSTDKAVHTRISPNAYFDPLKDYQPQEVDVPGGASVVLRW